MLRLNLCFKNRELEGEQFTTSSALTGDQARPDIRARGFYRPGRVAFFDVKVINLNSTLYLQHQQRRPWRMPKDRKHDVLLIEEHGSFAPLIYSVTGPGA